MLGRTPGNIIAIRPLREGVISDYEMTELMIKEFIPRYRVDSACSSRTSSSACPRSSPRSRTRVIDAGTQAGAKRVFLIEEPVAAAIGAGLDISRPNGNLVVDIGGGTTDIAVISLMALSSPRPSRSWAISPTRPLSSTSAVSINALIGDRTAEEIKRTVGCGPRSEEAIMEVRGRCLMTGLARTFTV